MRFAFTLILLLLARHAHADLRLLSTGRAVTVDLHVDGAKHSCTTPCVLDVPPGSYHARVDGLDRTVTAGDDEVIITPTRHGRLGVGMAILVIASTGLTLAGHWASPLDDRHRVAAGLGGAAALGFGLPFVTTASARVGGGATPSQADVFVGVHYVDEPMAVVGVGLRRSAWGFGAELRARITTDVDHYQLVAGPTFHFPALPLVRPAIAAHIGIASQRGETIIADPPIPGDVALHTALDVEARLELTNPGWVQPSIGATLQALPDRAYAIDVGVHVRF
jgi:hypothetical protein